MKTNRFSAAKSIFSPFLKITAAGVAALLFSLNTTQAANFNWDGAASGTSSDGSGTWHTPQWFNGTADQAWVDGTNAVLGFNTVGTYAINVDSAVLLNVLTFKTNSYTLSGANITYTNIIVSNGVAATINSQIGGNGPGWSIGPGGASLTLGGGYASTGGNPNFNGNNQTLSTLNITNGTYTGVGTQTYNGVTVNQTGGLVSYTVFNIGRTAAATYNLMGGILRNTTVGGFTISRGFPGIMNVSSNGLFATAGNLGLGSNTTNDVTTFSVSGGTVNVGTGTNGVPGVSATSISNIIFMTASGGYATFSKAILNISGGITTAKGLVFGSSVALFTNNPVCQVNVTGGYLYLDANGIALGSGSPVSTNLAINLGGGTIAATANWSGSVPLKLNNTNGTVTFQSANTNATPFNISLTGGLSGTGGLNKTGGGNLTLGGTNIYSGSTAVLEGQMTMSNAFATSIGPITVGSGAIFSTIQGSKGQSWTNAGFAMTNGATLDFNFAGVQLSRQTSVIRVNGDLTLDSSDSVTIEGSAILTGTYPLITCSGTLTLTNGGTLPTITSLPGGVSATLAQSGNTINLVVSSSPNLFLSWGPLATGNWDYTTLDWVSSALGNPATNFTDGISVNFDDNGANAVAITLNNNVLPGNVTANNTIAGTASFTVNGPGSIGGNTSVLLQGTGLLALGTTNTYNGGTIVNSGTLGINYGGDGSSSSAIGTGALTLNTGAALDNTSGTNIVLNTPLQENWNGNFSYVGSQSALDLGTGPVLLGSPLSVTVASNVLSSHNVIDDNGGHYALSVQGPGTLSLWGENTFTGGLILNSGRLNINNGGSGGGLALGLGAFTINGGTIDNTSGGDVQIPRTLAESWNSSFTFGGSGNLDLGFGTLSVAGLTLNLQGPGVLSTSGTMAAVGAGAVATMTLTGNGTFKTTGTKNNTGLSMSVGGGALYLMDKSSANNIHSVGGGLTVTPGGTARVTGSGGQQIIGSTLGPVAISGGTLDLNGSSETMYQINFNSGTLQNSSGNAATLTVTNNIVLRGSVCNIDVMTNSALTIPSIISGTGSVFKVDAGTLNLTATNTYTGTTTVGNGLLTINTATLANRSYTVTGGKLEVMLDPTGVKLQMGMSNFTFVSGSRLGFDLAGGSFGDLAAPAITAGALTINGNVPVDVFNAPGNNNDQVLFTYTSHHGNGLFVAGSIPGGAYIYDNNTAGVVTLTYTVPPPSSPTITQSGAVYTGSTLTGISFSGINGPANGAYQILSSTNVALRPLSSWTVSQTGNFDASGNLNTTVPITPGDAQRFYLLQVVY